MRNRIFFQCMLATLSFSVLSFNALAHHSTAAFDFLQSVELKGKVKRFRWANPHNYVQVIVTGDDGKETEWNLEVGTPATATKMGWSRDSFKYGDEVTIVIAPMKDGSPVGTVKTATLANGTTLTSVANDPNAAAPFEALPTLKRATPKEN